MALVAARVTPALVARVDDNYPAIRAKLHAALQCANGGPLWPELQWLRDAVLDGRREVFVAVDGTTFACCAVVQLDHKEIEWLLPNHEYDGGWENAAAAVCDLIQRRHGIAWGTVANDRVRDAMVQADVGFTVKGTRMEWNPPG